MRHICVNCYLQIFLSKKSLCNVDYFYDWLGRLLEKAFVNYWSSVSVNFLHTFLYFAHEKLQRSSLHHFQKATDPPDATPASPSNGPPRSRTPLNSPSSHLPITEANPRTANDATDRRWKWKWTQGPSVYCLYDSSTEKAKVKVKFEEKKSGPKWQPWKKNWVGRKSQ